MPIETTLTSDRASWLALRERDVTASTAAALLGAHPFTTLYALWALKTGRIQEDPEETPPMRRGRLMEAVAVQVLREEHPDWTVIHNALPYQKYFRDPDARLGATPDVFVGTPDGRRGVVQVKSVEASIFRKTWQSEPYGPVEPPLAYAVQAEIERHLTGADFAYVAALTVGHGVDLHLIEVPHVPGVIERIEGATQEFWRLVESGEEPSPDFAHDADVIEAIFSKDTGGEVDLSGDNRIPTLIEQWATEKATEKACKARIEALKAEFVHKLGGAAIGYIGGGRSIKYPTIHRKGYSVQPSTYRQLKVPEPA